MYIHATVYIYMNINNEKISFISTKIHEMNILPNLRTENSPSIPEHRFSVSFSALIG